MADETVTNGRVFEGNNGEKFVVLAGKKLLISDATTQAKLYGTAEVATADTGALATLKVGAPLTPAAHLIKLVAGPRVYWLFVEGAHYLTIIRADQLNAWQFAPTFIADAEVREISARELDMYIHTF